MSVDVGCRAINVVVRCFLFFCHLVSEAPPFPPLFPCLSLTMELSLLLAFVVSVFFAIGAHAESHTIKFVNQCVCICGDVKMADHSVLVS